MPQQFKDYTVARYARRAVGDGVTLIWETPLKPFYRCNIWHVRGLSGACRRRSRCPAQARGRRP